jgi:hypothetical protein
LVWRGDTAYEVVSEVTVTATMELPKAGRFDFGDPIDPGTRALGPVPPGGIPRARIDEIEAEARPRAA